MLKPVFAVAAAILFSSAASAALAQDSRYFVHVGPGQLAPDEDAVMSAGGATVPGANVSMDDSLTAAIELGYRVTPQFSLSLTGGLPPTEDVNATGSIAPYGKLGELQYGPAALMGQYRLTQFGAFQPYVGAGVAVMFVFKDDDAAATNLEVDNAVGPAVQAGAEWMINERFGLFLDYKRAWLDTSASGNLGPMPFTAEIQVDPSVLHGGVAIRF
jgi:outer membrane protein